MSVKHAVLALLSEGPKYGLQLREEFEDRTGDVWPLNAGQVYTTLQRLERDGLVESGDTDHEGPQKTFRITRAGRADLHGWLRTPHDALPPPRDELMIKVLIALRMPNVDIHDVLQVNRRQLVESMQRYTQLKGSAGDEDLGFLLIADAELFRLDALVRWLDAVDARLKRTPPTTDGPSRQVGTPSRRVRKLAAKR
jgi:DNA-binding PadR family transcriptional regulator